MPITPEQIQQMKKFDTDRDAADLQSKLNASIGRDPVRDAEVLTISNDSQLPFDMVERNLPALRKRGVSDPYDARGLIADHPRTAQYLSSGRNALAAAQDIPMMTDLEDELWGKRSGTPFLKNTLLGMGERTNDLTGNFIELMGNLYSEASAFDPSIEFGEDGMSFNFIDYDTPRDPNTFQRVGQAVSEGSLGYVPNFTWENLKGDLSVANLAGYVVETGAQSMVDMAAMLVTLPAYLASRTEEIAETRAENTDGRENVTLGDLAASVPTAVLVSLIDRFSAKGILGLTDEVVGEGFGFAAKEVLKKGAVEGATEFIQEQVEYAGEVLGTDVDFDVMASLDRGTAGLVAGGPLGAGVRALSLPANALAARTEREVSTRVESAVEQMSITKLVTKIKGMSLSQSAPAEQRKFLEGLDGDHRLYVTPEEVLAAADEGLPVPQFMLDQITNNPNMDVSLKVSEFGAEVVSNEQLLARLENHMKLSPNSLTRSEMDSKDSSKLSDMMDRAKQDSEIRSEADAIHATVVDQLVASKRMTRAQANRQAQIIPAYVTTAVERLRERGIDISVTEMYEKMNFTIEGGTAPTAGALQQSQTDTALAGFTGDRLTASIKEFEHARGDSSKGSVAFVNPADFLAATSGTAEIAADISEEAGDLDLDRLTKESSTPYVRIEQGRIIGHEGRHRMAALSAAGVTRVPIMVQHSDYQDIQMEATESMPMDLRGQQFGDGTGPNLVVTESYLALSQNQEFLEGKMGPAGILFQSAPGEPRSISTRQPTAKASTEDPLTESLIVDGESFLASSNVEKNLDLVDGYVGYRARPSAKTNKQRSEAFIRHVESNLLWLFDQVSTPIRKRSTQWYVGARRMADELAKRYDVSPEAVAAVMAALSPQKDWFMNVTQAERVLDIYKTHQNTAWDEKLEARTKEIIDKQTYAIKKDEAKGANKSKAWDNLASYTRVLNDIKGKKLSELDSALEKAVWIRLYDEVYYSRNYRVVSPEGYFQETQTNANGRASLHAWGSNAEIAKAVSVIEDDSFESISVQMGNKHKVRNFYNNIINPLGDDTSVTIDTHAVSAGLLKPLSSKSKEVAHNFGSGSGNSEVTGNVGTYALFAEAYRRAAAARGVLPREMQSITWEAVRGLYTASFKTKKNVDALEAIWAKYTDGKVSLAVAREEAFSYAEGIQKPSWSGPNSELSGGQAETSVSGDLSGTGLPGGDSAAVDPGAGVDAAGQPAGTRLSQGIEQEGPVTRGEMEFFSDNSRIIKLFETSDESTFLHESAHLFLETEKQLAAEFGLGENQQSILDFLGLKSFDNIPEEKHELFARTFEQYLRTGDAPSPSLRNAFVEFARWLSRVYQSALALNAPLTDETKGMFDRLLATQKEIEDSKTEPVWAQFFKDIKSAGMTEAEWEKYQAQVKKKSEAAEGSLYDKVTKQYMNRRTTEWNAERKPLMEMAMERLEESQIYGAIKAMKEAPLDSDALKPFIAGNAKAAGKFIALRKADGSGMDPRLYAEEYGFDSVAAMVAAITDAPALKVAAKAEAERLMVKKYGDILNDGTLEKEVRDSLHSAEQAKLLQMELAAMAKRRRTKDPLDLKAFRADAKKIISRMRAADIRPDKFYRAEVRAATAAGKAKTAEEAYQAKLQQLANHYLYKEALAARRDAAKYRNHLFGVLNRSYRTDTVAKEYVQEMKQLVRMYNMKTSDERDAMATKFFGFMSGQLEAGVPIDLKDHNLILLDHRNRLGGSIDFSMPLLSDLTMDQLRSVYEQLVHLRHMGGVEAQKDKAELVKKRQTMIDALQAKISKAAAKRQYKTEKQLERASAPKALWLKLPSLRNLIRDLDGGEYGAFAKLLWQPIHAAESKKLAIHKQWYDQLNELMKDENGKAMDLASINDSKESRVTIKGTTFSMTARERVMLALYWGEEYSREAVIDGYRKAPTGEMELDAEGKPTKKKKKGEQTVSIENVEKMLTHLTDTQIEIVNRIWQFHDYISAPLFESEYKRGGVAPEKIPAVPFSINGKAMRGGHMRLYYYGQPAMDLAAETSLISTNNVTTSKHGSLNERLGSGGKQVSMNMDNIFRNITEAIHKVAYTDAARELNQIYAHRTTREAITDAMGQGFDRALFENIRGLVTDLKEPEGDKYIAAASRWLRTSASSMYLAFGVRNIMQQFGTIITAVDELPGASYATAVSEFAADWDANVAMVNELSPQMASRDVNLNREHSEMLARVDMGSKRERIVQLASQYGFKPHVFIDGMIAYPLWLKVYNNAIEQHGDLARAASEADVSVAETVGSGLDINVGKFFRSNEAEFIKLMGLFGSWFNGVVFQRAYKATEGGSKIVSGKAVRQLIVVPFALAAATQWLVADFPNEDDEEGWLAWAAKTYIGFMSGLIPMSGMFVSEMRGFGAQSMTTSVAGKLAQGITLPTRAFGEDSEMTVSEGIYELLTIGGTLFPVPGLGNVTRVLQYYNSRQDGNEDEIEDILGWTQEAYQAIAEGSDKNR